MIIKENGDTYFVLRKSNSNETLFSNCIQLIEMAEKENPVEWIDKNAENFRKALEESLVHGKEEGESYTSYRNLEEKIEESIK